MRWVVYVRRDGIEIGSLKGERVKWAYPSQVVTNQEVIDRGKFASLWSQFWESKAGRGGKAIVVLGDDVTYQKTVTSGDEKSIQTFWDEVPIETAKIGKKIINEGNQVKLIATNKEIYELIMEGIKVSGGEVVEVVAATLLVSTEPANVWKDKNLGAYGLTGNFRKPTFSVNGSTIVWMVAGVIWVAVIVFLWLRR